MPDTLAQTETAGSKKSACRRGGPYVFEGNETNPRMVQMDNYGAALLALQTGDVDVVLTDGVNAGIFEANSGGAIRPVGEEFAGEDFGIAFPKGSDLIAAFDAAIAEMRADGFLETLDEKYLVAK